MTYKHIIYRIVGYFRGVLIFVIFMVHPVQRPSTSRSMQKSLK